MSTDNELKLALLNAIVSAVDAGGSMGVPSGVLYAALMTAGMTYEQYTMCMSVLVSDGILRQSGHAYFVTEKGRQFVS